MDTTGVFNGDLIAVTTAGDIWRVTSDRHGHRAGQGRRSNYLEGATVVPNDPDQYGPLAGKIVATDENQSGFYTIDTSGNAVYYQHQRDSAGGRGGCSSPTRTSTGSTTATARFVGAGSTDFTGMVGDLLDGARRSHGSDSGMYRVFFQGNTVQTQLLTLSSGSASAGQWEHFTFAAASE